MPIDAVAGTSFGALAGGMYAATVAVPGALRRTIDEVMGSVFSTRRMMQDINFPRTAYFTGAFLNRVLQITFARRRCEDTLVPFVCTTTDILNFEAKLHHEGPLWRIVRASMSLVGFVPPLPHQEINPDDGKVCSSLLVDGGYTNMYPTEELRDLGAGTVICVKACPEFDPVSTDYGDSVRGGAVALLRFFRLPWRWYAGPDPPPQSEIQERLMFLPDAIRQTSKGGLPTGSDLTIKPPIGGFGLLEFSRYRELEAIGYDTALPAIREWLAEGGLAAQRASDAIRQCRCADTLDMGCGATVTQTEYGGQPACGNIWRKRPVPKVHSAPSVALDSFDN